MKGFRRRRSKANDSKDLIQHIYIFAQGLVDPTQEEANELVKKCLKTI